MNFESLRLIFFRNHVSFSADFGAGVTVVVGDNARGKTNIIEALYLLSTGTSFRAQKIEEMVTWEAEVGHVIGKISNDKFLMTKNEETELMVTVTRGVVQGKRVQKRLYKVNGVPRRRQDFVGSFPCVLFRPEDMDLLTGSPQLRRQFLNEVLIQSNPEYRRSLESYEKALKRRNKLLDLIREGTVSRTALLFWDKLMIKEGEIITAAREAAVIAMNALPALSGNLEVVYDKSIISPERLHHYEQEELAVGYTLVGPHKDDFQVIDWEGDKQRDLAVYGSRGEQRMAVLWLKDAQLTYIAAQVGIRPLLLLDDILSELDEKHGQLVIQLAQRQQTVLTTTDEQTVELFPKPVTVIRL